MSVDSPLDADRLAATAAASAKARQASAARRLMPVLFVGVFMAALDTAIIGPAIPALRAAFGVDNRAIGLVMSVFILFSLCATALMAKLSDRYGRRPIYLASTAIFALGSLLIAVAPSFWLVIVSRAIQGIGAGGITPTASAVVGDTFAPAERGKALGLIGATYGMAFVLGPPLAALLLVALSWRWIFLINLPIAFLVVIMGARVLPSVPTIGTQPPLDRRGILVTFVLLAALMLAITHVLDEFSGLLLWPWFLGAAAALLAALIGVEARAEQPLIPLTLFANRQLAVTYGLALAAGFGMGAIVFVSSIATAGYGVTANRVGFVLLPLVLGSMFGSMGAGRLLNRIGARSILLVGFGLLTLGYAALSVTRFGLTGFICASIPVGLGLGVVVGGAMRSIAIDEAPAALRASAQGLINICNAIGTLLAAAVISAIADFSGSGIAAFALAYQCVAALMLLALLLSFALRNDRGVPGHSLD
jgi:multidrug resistance protein